MPEIIPPDNNTKKSLEIAPQKGMAGIAIRFTTRFRALPAAAQIVLGALSAGSLLGYFLWGFNEFTSLRGWIHVLTSRFVLASMWVAGTVAALIIYWGLRIKRWLPATVVTSALLLCVLIGLDYVAPKPSTRNQEPLAIPPKKEDGTVTSAKPTAAQTSKTTRTSKSAETVSQHAAPQTPSMDILMKDNDLKDIGTILKNPPKGTKLDMRNNKLERVGSISETEQQNKKQTPSS